jgi:hypothetical protein
MPHKAYVMEKLLVKKLLIAEPNLQYTLNHWSNNKEYTSLTMISLKCVDALVEKGPLIPVCNGL